MHVHVGEGEKNWISRLLSPSQPQWSPSSEWDQALEEEESLASLEIPPSAMARPLQDGSRRTEPTAAAAVSGSPAFPLGGTVALPPTFCRSPRPWTPRLNGGRGPCGPSPAPGHGSLHPGTLPGATQQSPRGEEVEEEGAAAAAAVEPEHGAAEANGHLPRHLPTLEQQIGARLRQMGDRFQQEYEQRERRPHGALWGHFYHLVFHMLGVLYNLPVRG